MMRYQREESLRYTFHSPPPTRFSIIQMKEHHLCVPGTSSIHFCTWYHNKSKKRVFIYFRL